MIGEIRESKEFSVYTLPKLTNYLKFPKLTNYQLPHNANKGLTEVPNRKADTSQF